MTSIVRPLKARIICTLFFTDVFGQRHIIKEGSYIQVRPIDRRVIVKRGNAVKIHTRNTQYVGSYQGVSFDIAPWEFELMTPNAVVESIDSAFY
jgi:hypothetical protein